ncbi:alpha/beta fold hydrolase [Arthrobacter bambusae]|uniref:Pimeloyl-ACP methyl ester carboxylesterase n=1 Tax=Arthrobacter bambusae TaxID=1338426 RepID=A0AAW8DMB3_9MICC|nr:alpha/beta hydrolase [Arthrobacter bambusae]MDP9907474.1 pimeloyl-ACP methyl ester carboxylesterase [Arthrobacter bambusae]MDQ0131679.1 pimeloyl-ACP methyl ester carboxylesterase [Arthrobacter bambusae]MDQ0183091.1 pimeloyl-ACP methyl ester carboxylesterase [Arthrobacter bambusae]
MREREVPTPDGGKLALYSYGSVDAPGERRVVLIGGAFLTALIYRPFSMALSKGLGEGWAVDVYDRRGRGSSSELPANYSMDTEIADVRSILDATGARNLLGHSLGGSVALNAVQEFAGTSYEPDKLAVYDAAVNIDGSMDTGWLDGFAQSVDSGNVGRAMARMKRGMQPGTALARIPEPILAGLMALVSRTKVNKVLRGLMPTGVAELKAAYDEAAHPRDFSVLPRSTRFIVGSKSPEYYKVTAERLYAAVPGSTLVVSPKGFHGSIPAAVKELVTDISSYFKD